MNIYTDVAPFAETAVVLGFHDKTMSQQQKVEQCKEKNYINASFIKSSLMEHTNKENEPFGHIIAT